MAKSSKSAKTSGFDVDKYIAEMQEQSRREKEAEEKREALIKEYSIRWNRKDNDPPFPGMTLNAWRCRWEPKNIEEFIREHGEDFKKLINAGANNPADSSESAKTNPSQSEISSAPESSEAVQQGHQCTDTTVAPAAEAKAPSKVTTKSKASAKPEVKPESLTEPPIPAASSDETTSNKSEPFVGKGTAEVVEQSKNTRISSKMVNADFDELAREFLHITSLGEKKPVFIPLELRNALETLARLSGVPNLAPSHIVINILQKFFDDHRDLINRKLSGVKLSV